MAGALIVRGRLRPGMRVGCDPGRILLISACRSVVRADHREAEAAAGAYPSWVEAFFSTARRSSNILGLVRRFRCI